MPKSVEDYKLMVIGAASLAPLLGGAIIYYTLKNIDEDMAKLGNNISFVAFAGWIALNFAGVPIGILLGPLGLIGLALAIYSVLQIKKITEAQVDPF